MNRSKRDLDRKSHRLQSHDYASAAAYFITIVTKSRHCLFGHVAAGKMILSPLGRIADKCFRSFPEHFGNAEVDVYQVMPNHVHGIVVLYEIDHRPPQAPGDVGAQHAAPLRAFPHVVPGSIGAIIRSFKSAVSRSAHLEVEITNIWQRNYYDHIIRNEKEWRAMREYVLSNPSNWNDDEENPESAGFLQK